MDRGGAHGYSAAIAELIANSVMSAAVNVTVAVRSLAAAAAGLGALTVANRARTAPIPTPRPRGAVLGSTILAVAAVAILRAGGQPASDLGPALDAVLARDYPTVQAVILLFSVVYVVLNLIVDVTYTFLDPRIRY